MTPSGNEPATFRLVAQCLNQLQALSTVWYLLGELKQQRRLDVILITWVCHGMELYLYIYIYIYLHIYILITYFLKLSMSVIYPQCQQLPHYHSNEEDPTQYAPAVRKDCILGIVLTIYNVPIAILIRVPALTILCSTHRSFLLCHLSILHQDCHLSWIENVI
jgi:hypothetical protein